MLQLIIYRHAKSGWDAATDIERTLTKKGEQQALFMGDLLKEKALTPDLVLCSSAQRARDTLELTMQSAELQVDTHIIEALYNTTPGAVLNLLAQLGDDRVVMIVGHEPTWSELATGLCNTPVSFSTAGMALILLDIDNWKAIQPGIGRLDWYEHP